MMEIYTCEKSFFLPLNIEVSIVFGSNVKSRFSMRFGIPQQHYTGMYGSQLACTKQTLACMHLGWPAHNRHTGMHLSHAQMTTRAGSLVYVRVESGCDRTGEDICEPTDHSSSFDMATVVDGLSPFSSQNYQFIIGGLEICLRYFYFFS